MKTDLSIGNRIAYYRRLNAMTQEELSSKLNVSTQAVSKWEQQLSSPDIMLLPVIAETFHISVDELFGKKLLTEPIFSLVDSVPWDDDSKIRFAVFHGKKLLEHSDTELSDGINTINIHLDYGELYKINGICKLNKE
ncbi:MAG: helix-turn-helix transcriptional regulator [Clostridia bacterium]|nr:helix-turn-helix transcriptional regulator [Clostridia bacterium]